MVETVIIDSDLERIRNPCRGSIEMDPFWRRRAAPPVCQAGGGAMLKYIIERLWGALFKETSVLGTTRHAFHRACFHSSVARIVVRTLILRHS